MSEPEVRLPISDLNMSTHRDLHRQQSLARIFGINGELDRQRGGHAGGVEAGSAGTHLAGVVGRQDLHLVRAARGRQEVQFEQQPRITTERLGKNWEQFFIDVLFQHEQQDIFPGTLKWKSTIYFVSQIRWNDNFFINPLISKK